MVDRNIESVLNNAKMQQDVAEKSRYADQGTCNASQVIGAAGQGRRVPLIQQIGRSYAEGAERTERLQRAHDILSRHPEFEEYMELQELINRGLFR